MSLHHNPRIPKNGLILALDAASVVSNPHTGTTWYDISGNGHNFSVPSNSNTGDIIQFASNSSGNTVLSNTNTLEITFDTWFYAGSGGTYTGCCDTLFGTYWCRTFIIGQGLYTMIGFMNGSGTYTQYQHPNYTVSYGSWHHTVGMRRGDRYIIWIDGVEVYNSSFGSGEYLYGLGGNWNFAENNRHSNLKIAAARVWNRGLTDTEISNMFDAQRTRFGL